MEPDLERAVALDVERQLSALCARVPTVAELPLNPIRGIADLVRLELALRRFAQVHRSRRSMAGIRAVEAILARARSALREATDRDTGEGARTWRDTEPGW